MYVYFARHGQTVWNVENKICGSTDIALTDKGRLQEIALGEKIRDEKLPIDMILCSPLVRAAETADIAGKIARIPVAVEPRLIEQCFGRFEGTPRNGEDFARAKTHFLDSYDGGESMMRVGQRIYNLLDEISRGDKTILLVAHNGIARFVRSYFEDLTNDEFAANGIRNCEVIRYEFRK